MKVNKTTMLIEVFHPYLRDELEKSITEFIINGESSEYLYECFNEWREKCGFDSTQGMLLISTAFPQRLLLSIMKDIEWND